MIRTNVIGRTVMVFDMKEKTFGDKTIKEVLFRIATPRGYKRKVTTTEGTKDVRDTDYMLCKATGKSAQFINDYLSERTTEGKLVSRLINIIGTIETYTKKVQIEAPAFEVKVGKKGTTITIPAHMVEHEQKEFIMNVTEIEPLDSIKSEKPLAKAKITQSVAIEDIEIDEDDLEVEVVGTSAEEPKEEAKPKTKKGRPSKKKKEEEKVELPPVPVDSEEPTCPF